MTANEMENEILALRFLVEALYAEKFSGQDIDAFDSFSDRLNNELLNLPIHPASPASSRRDGLRKAVADTLESIRKQIR